MNRTHAVIGTTIAIVALLASFDRSPSPVVVSSPATAGLVAPEFTPSGAQPSTDALASAPQTYREDRVMVRANVDTTLEQLASTHGTIVERAAGARGLGALAVPAGIAVSDFIAELSADDAVATIGHEARFSGAAGPPAGAQWHMNAIARPAQDNTLSTTVVAVVDTGVAYENYTSGGTTYKKASGFNGVTIVAPLDLVQNDGHPNDDHQHGTHIASLILSKSAIKGVSAGAALMPIKVLDSTNSGTEIDLIDAIDHAVANGADVINLSLAFPLGYVASVELQQALLDAHNAGVIMVGAAGNDGEDELAWPAASPVVISVGSTRSDATGPDDLEWYSNRGPGLDVVAPGGSLALDNNGDGWADGLAAQTIQLNTPGTTQYVMYQGTSQAAALVSGAVVRLLDDGVAPEDVRARLQGTFSSGGAIADGNGSEILNVTDVRASTASDEAIAVGGMAFVRKFVTGGVTEIEPTLRVVAVDDAGVRITDGEVLVQVEDDVGLSWHSCTITSATGGMCEIAVGRYTDNGSAPDAWIYSIVGVERNDVAHRPVRAIFSSDGTEVIMAAIDDAAIDADRAIALWWPAGTDAELGLMIESFSVSTTGVELADAPVIGSFLRGHIAALLSTETDLQLDLEGTGLYDTPTHGWGFMDTKELDLDGGGTGILGNRMTKLLVLNGSEHANTDLGWHGAHMFASHTGVIAPQSHGLGLNGLAVRLDQAATGAVAGTFLGDFVDAGGDVAADGFEATRALPAAGTVTVGRLLATDTINGSGDDSEFLCDDDE